MKADGIEYDERMRLLEEVTWPRPLAELLEATYEIYRERHPWLDPGGARAEVGGPGDVGAGDGLHRLRRPLPAGPLRGAGAALPHRRLPDAAADGARSGTGRPSSTSWSSGWGRRSGRPTPRCSTSGRRWRTRPTSVRRRGRARAASAAAADVGAGAAVPGDDPQRDVAPGGAGGARRRRPAWLLWRPTTAELADPPLEVAMTRTDWDAGLEGYYADHDAIRLDADARGPTLSRDRDDRPRPGRSGRPSTTRRAITTGSSTRPSTSTPPTSRVRPSCSRPSFRRL